MASSQGFSRAYYAFANHELTMEYDRLETAGRVAAFKHRMAERGLSFPAPVVKPSGDPIRPTKGWDVT